MAHVPERKYDMSYLFEQVAQLVKKLSKSGWSKSDVTLLGQASAEKLNNVLLYLHGQIDIVRIKHTIDLAKSPRLPFDGADEVVKHDSTINGKNVVEIELRSDDNLYIDGKKVVLHLSERQIGNKTVVGHELRKELESGERVLLNSNVLDYLYDHPELFPEHWKKDGSRETRYIHFWGSVFRDPSGVSLCVRYLYWGVGGLYRYYGWLDRGWVRRDPAASLASN